MADPDTIPVVTKGPTVAPNKVSLWKHSCPRLAAIGALPLLTTLFALAAVFSLLPHISVLQKRAHAARQLAVTDHPASLAPFFITRRSPAARRVANQSWAQPVIFSAIARPDRHNDSYVDLLLVTVGISMGVVNRNWMPVACLVSTEAFPISDQHEDTTFCNVSRRLRPGEPLSLVFNRADVDYVLQNPIFLGGVETPLDPSLFVDLDPDLEFSFALNSSRADYVMLTDWYTMDPKAVAMTPDRYTDYGSMPRYGLCAMTQVRELNHLIQPWVNYHRRVGVDYFLILDNNQPGEDESLERMFARRSDVDVFYWPWAKSQIQAITYGIVTARHRCDAIASFDIDEYAMVGLGKKGELAMRRPFAMYLREKWAMGYGGVEPRMHPIGSSAVVRRPKKAPPEVYLYEEDGPRTFNIKPVVRTDHEWISNMVHYANGRKHIAKFVGPFPICNPVTFADEGLFVHYSRRSHEEMVKKYNTGTGSAINGAAVVEEEHKIRVDMDDPPEEYLALNASLRNTNYRKIYRTIMREAVDSMQMVVRVVGKRRCERLYNLRTKRWAEEEHCEYKFGIGEAVRSADDRWTKR